MEPYESRFAALFGADYAAFSFWKGRVALYAILQALGIGKGDEVILPGYTCVVVANSIRYTGATPVYADIAPGTFNLAPASIRARLTSRTRAVIAQHTYGIPADLDSLQAIAADYKLQLIEDCAHVLPGAKYRGELLGTSGKAAFFSSQWSKPYTTGLGGLALTRDRELAARLSTIQAEFARPALLQNIQLQIQYALYQKLFRPKLYWFSQKSLHALSQLGIFVGSSDAKELIGRRPIDSCWTMGSFQQRAGLRHLENLEANSAHRQSLSRYYSERLRRPQRQFYGDHNAETVTLLRFPVTVDKKQLLLEESSRTGIEIGSWFETPLHPLALADHRLMQYQVGSCPVAESTASRVINLPLHDRVSRSDADRIVEFVLNSDSAVGRRKEVYAESH